MKKIKQVIDPAFLRETKYSYVNYNNEELSTVLSFALARHKTDLILHQQRIELFAVSRSSDMLFTAISDLFTALEDKGIEYKQRMLEKYKHIISKNQAIVLTNSLKTNLPNTAVLNLQESILNLGNQGELLSAKHLQTN